MAPNTKKVKLSKEEENQSAAFEKIALLQEEVSKLDEELEAETAVLQAKYDKMKKPFFDQRKEHISKLTEFWANVVCRIYCYWILTIHIIIGTIPQLLLLLLNNFNHHE